MVEEERRQLEVRAAEEAFGGLSLPAVAKKQTGRVAENAQPCSQESVSFEVAGLFALNAGLAVEGHRSGSRQL